MSAELRYLLLRHDVREAVRRRLMVMDEVRAVHRLASGALVLEVEGELPDLVLESASMQLSLDDLVRMGWTP